jgi:hypothetical protein
MTKTAAAFTALNEQFLSHHESGNTIAVYPLSAAAFTLTCETIVPFHDKVALEMAQADCAERMDTIYRAAREALGWDRQEWYCRVPNDDAPDELLAAAGLSIDSDA